MTGCGRQGLAASTTVGFTLSCQVGPLTAGKHRHRDFEHISSPKTPLFPSAIPSGQPQTRHTTRPVKHGRVALVESDFQCTLMYTVQ